MLHSIVLLLPAFVGLAVAQFTNILGLSDSCNQALGQLFVGGPAANCLNTLGLLNVITAPSTQSWVPSLDSYLTATCSQPACTNETISAAITSLTSGCSSDLAARNWSADQMASLLQNSSHYYYPARDVMCLRDTGENQSLCITKLLTDWEATTGQTFNVGTMIAKTPAALSGKYILTITATPTHNSFTGHSIDIPQNISCTPCTQAAYTIARPNLPSESSVQAWDTFWIKQCGENFISGTIPTSIAQTANQTTETTTPVPSSAALTMTVPPLGVLFGSFALMLVSILSILARG